jgi:adenylate cyclase
MDTRMIVDWLVGGIPGAKTPSDVLGRVCDELATGMPLHGAEVFVRTLHPHIVGRSFVWEPGIPVAVRDNSYAYLQSPTFLASPLADVFRTGEYVRCRAGERALPESLAGSGFTDYVAAPFTFLSGQVHAVTLMTRARGGFSDEDVAAIRSVVPPLTRIAEILALSRTAVNLLNTYVGRNAGERILAGKIQRGDIESIRAVIWFSDLRGFSSLSGSLSPGEVIAMLNELFECQVSAIETRGGEVLKFMGDGMLAIFPVEGDDAAIGALCSTALEAADEAFAALASLNARRALRVSAPLRFGLALHIGEVAYGNIGGAGRLDFTCIGAAVNLAARIEALTSKLDRLVLVSESFANASPRACNPLGAFELKGIAGAQNIFAPIVGP